MIPRVLTPRYSHHNFLFPFYHTVHVCQEYMESLKKDKTVGSYVEIVLNHSKHLTHLCKHLQFRYNHLKFIVIVIITILLGNIYNSLYSHILSILNTQYVGKMLWDRVSLPMQICTAIRCLLPPFLLQLPLPKNMYKHMQMQTLG